MDEDDFVPYRQLLPGAHGKFWCPFSYCEPCSEVTGSQNGFSGWSKAKHAYNHIYAERKRKNRHNEVQYGLSERGKAGVKWRMKVAVVPSQNQQQHAQEAEAQQTAQHMHSTASVSVPSGSALVVSHQPQHGRRRPASVRGVSQLNFPVDCLKSILVYVYR